MQIVFKISFFIHNRSIFSYFIFYKEGEMIRKSLYFLLIVTILFMPFTSKVTAVRNSSPSFYELYWLIPSSVRVVRLFEEFTLQELKQLEIATKHLNPHEGEYSHSVFSPCGGSIHLHPVESMTRYYKFYPTLRSTSYYKMPSGEMQKTLVFLSCAKNTNGDWLFFHFDIHKILSLKAVLLDQHATIQWEHWDDSPVEASIDGFMGLYQTVWNEFEENHWSDYQDLLSICFSGKLWESLLFTCQTIDLPSFEPNQESHDFVMADSPTELLHWYKKDFEKTRIRDYRFNAKDREALANFLNHTREKVDFSFTDCNVIAYTDYCYYLEDESRRRLLYVGEVTYCPIPECFKNCCLKAIHDENEEWSFSYTNNTMIKDKVFLKTYGLSPLIENCQKDERLYLQYLNALGLLLLNEEEPSSSELITLLFSMRLSDSYPKKY
jgi:Ca2+/Na+ antiporter